MAMQIPYVRWSGVVYGVAEQVSPLIRRVTAEKPGPFTFSGTGTYIVGQGEVAVIDPGPRLDAHLEALLRALEGERVTHILVTHTHLDHSPLAHPLAERTGARIWAAKPPVPSHAAEIATEEGLDEVFRPNINQKNNKHNENQNKTNKTLATPG